ncbi:hypothetical protein HUU53_01275 [Candidatus Micrarchaeota archaeon]|nr:hypothetical protein [Candidatus Micrarchaeota archaeon]
MIKIRFVSWLLLVYFAAALVFGLFTGWTLFLSGQSFFEDPGDVSNAVFIIGYVLFSTVMLFLILKFYKGASLFQVVEYLLYFSAAQVFASLFVSQELSMIAGLAAAGLRLASEKMRVPLLLFSAGVVGGLLGASLDFLPAVILGIGLSAYDLYAVFYSKHMVALAEKLGERKAAFAVSLNVQKERITLGTGDLVIPVMLATAFLKTSLVYGLASIIGSVIGLFCLIVVMEARRGYYPALPPIVGGSLVASGLVFAVSFL